MVVSLKEETNFLLEAADRTIRTPIYARQGSEFDKVSKPHLMADTVKLTLLRFWGWKDPQASIGG